MIDERNKAKATAAIKKRMITGEAFTYAGLCGISTAQGGDEGKDRNADRAIQRWRKKGWIEFTREGRLVVWKLTEKGAAEAAGDLS